jgi:aromatic-L-amino-acid decarboxylase
LNFREDGQAALEWAASYLERVRDLPVLARVEPGQIRSALPDAPPEQGEPFSSVLRDLDEVLLPGITHWQHPGFFAYFATTGSEPGILAELLAATLNVTQILWRASPAATELEVTVMDWLAQLLGLPREWHGHIEDSASTSTLAALAAARHAHEGRVVLCSEHAHSSVEKAARLLDLAVQKVPADARYRIRTDGLVDLEGACALVATVGTTSSTAVDPVGKLAEICEREHVWLHVDAAYAGSAMVCPEFRWAWEGVERADSVVVNPHKWLFTPVDCSALWTRRPDELHEAMTLVPEYLRSGDEDALNLSEYGPALGRRFRALKLWAVLRCYGREGLQERIREAVRLAELFESWVRGAEGWEVVTPRDFSVVCFRREASDEENASLLERVNASGEAFISHTVLDGRYVLRLAVGNARTTEADVGRAWEVLERSAR